VFVPRWRLFTGCFPQNPTCRLSSSDVAWFPTRYETQMDIPPGDYNLEVVLSGEEKFGRAEALHNTTELSASCFPSRILKCSSTVAEF